MIPSAQKAHDEVHGLRPIRDAFNKLWDMTQDDDTEAKEVIESGRRKLDSLAMELTDYIFMKEKACQACEFKRKCGDPMM